MHHILIDAPAGLNNSTVADLSKPTYNAAEDLYEFSFANPVGRFPLYTLPEEIGGGNVDLLLQRIEVVTVSDGDLRLTLPNGASFPFYLQGGPPPYDEPRWNVPVPQGCSLRAYSKGNPAQIEIFLYEYGSAEWHRFQCCHIFTPIEQSAVGP